MIWEVVLSVATGVMAATGATSAIMLLRQCKQFELSGRALLAIGLAFLCAWCIESAIHLDTELWQAGAMLILSSHTLYVFKKKLPLRSARDLNPFADH